MKANPPLRSLLVAQFLGAFNDNAWKMFVIVLGTRGLGESASQAHTTLAFVVFTLPLMVFSLPSGSLADRLSKRTVLVAMKALEIALMALGAFVLPSTPLMLLVLALMGMQSAIFSPAKYGIVPELVPHSGISAANGALGLWTFLAIILGTALGPPLVSLFGGRPWLGAGALVALAAVGFRASLGIPRVPAARAEGGVVATVRLGWDAMRKDRALWLAAVGSAWFWGVSSLLAQNFIVYSKTVLRLSEGKTGMPLGVYGVGVGLGSWLAGRLSHGKVELGLVAFGAVGIGAWTLVFGLALPGLLFTLVVLGLLGIFSGFLIVPLDSLLQWRAPADRRGAVISLSNVLVFGGMLAGSLLGGLLAGAGLGLQAILVTASIATLAGTVWALRLLPEAFLRLLVFLYTNTLYRMRVIGREHVPLEGGVLLTPNHVSFMDGLFLLASLDRQVRFLVDEGQYGRPMFKPFLRIMGAIPVLASGGTKQILRALRDAGAYLDQGEVVCIFPEGQITRTGFMQPWRRGLERIVKGRSAPIVPVHLDRVWGSIFSYAHGKFVRKLPEEIPYPVTVSFGEPLAAGTPLHEIREAVSALDERAWMERKADRRPLHRTFVSAARRRPWRLCMADDRGRRTRIGALAGAVALARALRPHWGSEPRAGILLPPSAGGALVNLAALLAGKTCVNLNYTAGAAGMASAAGQAGLGTCVTSRAFLAKAGIEPPEGVAPVFLEDLAIERGRAFLLALLAPKRALERACGATRPASMDDLATVIFSSGSTGEPKGVMLSHFNVDSNVEGVAQVFRLFSHDRLLGILPFFHSFGFLSLFFALNKGVPVLFHANPLDAAEIGPLVERERITLLLATPTFLQFYLRRCTPEQFGSLRVVVAGAEKLSERFADAFEDRFGIRPLEGYGMTECSPVVAMSTPSFRAPGFYQPGARRGSVGAPLPGVAVRIVDPESERALPPGEPGLLLVKGPNVMQGYLGRPDLTEQAMRGGWYKSGDLAAIDDEGFLRITDRLSRFSKIGGEMVPHGRIEEALHDAIENPGPQCFAVTSVADEKKGERLAVLHTVDEAQIPEILRRLAASGLPNLFLPRADSFVRVPEIPKLGTGKTDLRAARRMAQEALEKS